MLVLSRRKGEKIVIGNEIKIEVLSVGREGVRLGITAPKETSVHRHEVFVEIEAANQAAEKVVQEIDSSALEKLSIQFQQKEGK
ncbi:MAG: carbon storage regulator CsrA [Pyrinomonadaceae bacterium]|nr:carbon storage regulator CsrA [Pyrinomonadaceae bacterium]